MVRNRRSETGTDCPWLPRPKDVEGPVRKERREREAIPKRRRGGGKRGRGRENPECCEKKIKKEQLKLQNERAKERFEKKNFCDGTLGRKRKRRRLDREKRVGKNATGKNTRKRTPTCQNLRLVANVQRGGETG